MVRQPFSLCKRARSLFAVPIGYRGIYSNRCHNTDVQSLTTTSSHISSYIPICCLLPFSLLSFLVDDVYLLFVVSVTLVFDDTLAFWWWLILHSSVYTILYLIYIYASIQSSIYRSHSCDINYMTHVSSSSLHRYGYLCIILSPSIHPSIYRLSYSEYVPPHPLIWYLSCWSCICCM